MITSAEPLSTIPMSTDSIDASVASAFSALLANQDAKRAYLFRAWPYDPVAGAEVEVNCSLDTNFTIFGNTLWKPRLAVAVDSTVELFGEEIDTIGRTSFGDIQLAIGDRDLDALTGYFWDGRDIQVLMGAPDFDLSQFEAVLLGTAEGIVFDRERLSVVWRGKDEFLNVPIQENLYAGTGGLEGQADLVGVRKPTCWGGVNNISPIPVDRANQIYQFHDGSAKAVSAGYDGAAQLTNGGNVADIEATTVTPGQYKTQLSGGYVRLGAEPAKTFTIDAQGDDTGGYVSTAADIIRRIVTTRSVLTDTDLDLPSFATANIDNSAGVGLWNPQGTVGDAITELIQSIGGSRTFSRLGKLVVAVFKLGSPVGVIKEIDMRAGSFQRVRTANPTWRRRIGYAKNYTIQDQDAVVASATDPRKDFVAREYRYAVSEDASIRTRRKLAGEITRDTLISGQTDAQTEAVRQQGLYGADRDRYDVTLRRQQFKYRPGQTVKVYYNRFSFPRDMLILSIRENTSTGTTDMRLWG